MPMETRTRTIIPSTCFEILPLISESFIIVCKIVFDFFQAMTCFGGVDVPAADPSVEAVTAHALWSGCVPLLMLLVPWRL